MLNTIIAYCSNREAHTGKTTQNDFEKYGKHYLKFFITRNRIGVEVNGFCSIHSYNLNPKSKKDIRINDFFVSRYIDTCDNPQVLRATLKVN
jgi:hypothetical protein